MQESFVHCSAGVTNVPKKAEVWRCYRKVETLAAALEFLVYIRQHLQRQPKTCQQQLLFEDKAKFGKGTV